MKSYLSVIDKLETRKGGIRSVVCIDFNLELGICFAKPFRLDLSQ
jgi:hypothetical protein